MQNDTHRKFNLPPIAAKPLHAVRSVYPRFCHISLYTHTHPVWNIRRHSLLPALVESLKIEYKLYGETRVETKRVNRE